MTNDGTGCTPGLNCPDVKVDIRIGNTALTNFGAYVASQATPLPVSWDPAIEGQANAANVGGATGCAPGTATAFLLNTGWLDFTLNAPFNWTGGNVIIDVSWLRNTTVGSSPQVRVETLGYTASKWVRVNAGLNPSHGCTYNDNPLPGNGITGNTMDRPVTRWYGKVQSNGFGTPTTGNYLNYGGGLVLDTNAAPGAISDAAYRGPGTIRAMRAVYDGTTQLSDHVFDSYFDGEVAPEYRVNRGADRLLADMAIIAADGSPFCVIEVKHTDGSTGGPSPVIEQGLAQVARCAGVARAKFGVLVLLMSLEAGASEPKLVSSGSIAGVEVLILHL